MSNSRRTRSASTEKSNYVPVRITGHMQVQAPARQSTSQKHRSFVAEPMGRKPVTELPGVGRTLGQRLERAGASDASNVLGVYLTMGENRSQFQDWMKTTTGANSKQANDCYEGLKDWSDSFMR